MIRVDNKKAISKLSKKSLKSNRTRNVIAVIAIVLTSLLFTTFFTIAGTLVNSYQQQTFRQAGGDFHGTFKDISTEQIEKLSGDPLVVKSGSRLMLGMPEDAPFNKTHVEVSYMNETCAKGYFAYPQFGHLPEENTDQIACDTKILSLLGIEPEIGAKISLSYYIGSDTDSPKLVTDTFTLSGWWEYDPAVLSSNALVPLSYANKVLSQYDNLNESYMTGKWSLNVYLKNSTDIDGKMQTILKNNGYQNENQQEPNYVSTGVNWAYLGAKLSDNIDPGTVLSIAALLILIVFTGYLIIYNIFQISVTNDIRFYGLLKTIGTTGRQLRSIIRRQALTLALIGIPIGLALGYLFGYILAPIVISTLSYKIAHTTSSPLIFIGAAVFSLLTVLISAYRPARIAGSVSAVEAVRYTENSSIKKTVKKSAGKTGIASMAFANLGRSKRKTALVIVSLSLAVVLLQVTCTFTNGFDMDKYLQKFVVTDFIVGDAGYFQVASGYSVGNSALTEDSIKEIEAQEGIIKSGRIYGKEAGVQQWLSEDYYRNQNEFWMNQETLDLNLKYMEKNSNGQILDRTALYGMEAFPLEQLEVIEGDLSKLNDPSQKAIAAVYMTDDYGNPMDNTNWAKVGDTVTLRYVEEWEYYDIRTGKTVDPDTVDVENVGSRASKFREESYTVAACVTMRNSMSFRFYGASQFILNSEVFKEDSQTENLLNYLIDASDEKNEDMQAFLENYTGKVDTSLDFESKQSYVDEFEGFRSMFLLMGGVLSLIIGIVGILNFFNAVLTSIMTRKREFAMLQSIGMTGRQLKSMLVFEGVFYALIASLISLVLSLAAGPILDKAMSSMFWFFTYRFTILPVAVVTPVFVLLGIILPLITYSFASKQTIVERLRETE